MKKILSVALLSFLVSLFAIPSFVSAQSALNTDTDEIVGQESSCVVINDNIRTSVRVRATKIKNIAEDVINLQEFFIPNGYFSRSIMPQCRQIVDPIPHYGPCSVEAVINFKKDYNIYPLDGFVGKETRKKINEVSCSGTATPVVTPLTTLPNQTQTTITQNTSSNQNLPAGCSSTVGFSPLSGVRCVAPTIVQQQASNLPAGCTSTTGFSSTTGGSCSRVVTSTSISPSIIAPTKLPEPTPSIATQTSIKLNSCREITEPGMYLLDADISNTQSNACIKIQNVSNVSLDCQNHTITNNVNTIDKIHSNIIYVKGASDFKINNCKLTANAIQSNEIGVGVTPYVLRIEDSQRGDIYNATISGRNQIAVDRSTNIKIHDSIISSMLTLQNSNNVIITKNSFSLADILNKPTVINLSGGHSNSVISNNIDGRSDGIRRANLDDNIGADEGIIIDNESQDIIQGNTIQNVWDCGIENTGYMFDSKIIGNTIKNAGECGIGGWYWSSVKGNLVKDNIVDNTQRLFWFFRQFPLKPTEQYAYFKDNVFENNKFINSKNIAMPASVITIEAGDVPSSSIVVGNNIFKNNNFTTTAGSIIFTPPSMIVDGGGNICPNTATNAGLPAGCASTSGWSLTTGNSCSAFPLKCGKSLSPVVTIPVTTTTITAPNIAGLPDGCSASSGFSKTTGISCLPTTTIITNPNLDIPIGCTSTSGFSSVNGSACDGTTQSVPTYPSGCTSTSGWSLTTGSACDGSTQPQPVYPAGCTSNTGWSSTTGNSCLAVSTTIITPPSSPSIFPAGCTSNTGWSSTTGNSCSTTSTTTTTPLNSLSTYPAGCTSSTGWSSTTGESCSTAQ